MWALAKILKTAGEAPLTYCKSGAAFRALPPRREKILKEKRLKGMEQIKCSFL
jgi:hypothetical protein